MQLLQRAGHEVLGARDAAEALRILTRRGVDLVVTDILMPGLTPREFLDWMGHLHPGVRILLMTGCHDAELRDHGIDPDRVALRKPFEVQDLVRGVAEALESVP